MPKSYSFVFSGTKEAFLNSLKKHPNNNQKFFFFNDYIIDTSENGIRFGVARSGHSGGYWFVPTITETDNKTKFCGTIQYVNPHASEEDVKKTDNKTEEIFLQIILLPIIIIVKIYLFFCCVIRKMFKQIKPKEKYLEDRLYNLMEKHLNCTRQ